MRVFIDANVLVSSFTSNSLSRKLVDLLTDDHEIIVSPQVLEETRRVITEKFNVEQQDLDAFIDAINSDAEVILPPYSVRPTVRDPDDIDILAAAIKGKADVFVTGDKDLLDLMNPPIRIVRPRELYDELTKENP